MRTRQAFSIGAGVVLFQLLMTIVFTPYVAAGDEVDTYIRQLQSGDAGDRLGAALTLGTLETGELSSR